MWEFYKGVIPGLREWKDVLRPSREGDQWRPLVMNHILPSMSRYVKAQFRVDPLDQESYLEVVTGEFQWLDILSPAMIGEVMVADVFPMWQEVLYGMLTAENVDYEAVAQWCSWWVEEVFPEELRSLPSVAAEFEKGIIMINDALDLGDRARSELEPPQKGPALPAEKAPPKRREAHHSKHRHHGTTQHAAANGESEEMSIRGFVEDWCENNELQFIPERKKVHAQGPLYRITARGDGRGGVLTYFKGIRLYAETKKGPVEIRADREDDLDAAAGPGSVISLAGGDGIARPPQEYTPHTTLPCGVRCTICGMHHSCFHITDLAGHLISEVRHPPQGLAGGASQLVQRSHSAKRQGADSF